MVAKAHPAFAFAKDGQNVDVGAVEAGCR